MNYSRLLNTAALGTGEKTAVLETRGKQSQIIFNKEKTCSGLENRGGIGGTGEAVSGGAELGGTYKSQGSPIRAKLIEAEN